ncbi:hypothetical protein Patl1_18900 [Pistacia atlantica]|uniref:Uncharacterized protein n=1 Tax=Pistacia atlantica TaxID=434234 RepID=A0ACC1C0K8_9ROSI|nr:hypothetical protein Patl1_18900 [Pistacia atlantica]
MAEPLVMNLSGEALNAYNEAYEELMKINESEEEDSPSGFYEMNRQNGGVNGSLPHHTHNIEKISKEFNYSQVKASEEQGLSVEESLDVGLSGCDDSDFDDEMEKQLIKQIVEKTRKGSPALLNAQKLLFFLDKDEH